MASLKNRYDPPADEAIAAITNLLLDKKVSVLKKDENEKLCCYHYAARTGNWIFVKTLAERKSKLAFTDKDGNTGLHICAEYSAHPARSIESILEDIEFQKKHGASEDSLKGRLENLEEEKASLERYFKTAKAFIEGGVDRDEKNEYGKSARDIAADKGSKKIAALLAGEITGDETAEDSAAGALAAGGQTLHEAAEKGDVEAIQAIIASGADPNGLCEDSNGRMKDFAGATALAVACVSFKAEAAAALLSLGADPAFKDSKGKSALCYFFTVDASLNANGNVFEEKRIPKIIKAMLDKGLSINEIVDDEGNTILNLACGKPSDRGYNHHTVKGTIIDEAIKAGADVNTANNKGQSPLMFASRMDADIMENYQLAFLDAGADTGARDLDGNTALHYAAMNDSGAAAKNLSDMLLEFGADPKCVNNNGKSALDIATENDNETLVKLLLSKLYSAAGGAFPGTDFFIGETNERHG
jgi:ankyrin repeat protein